MVEKHYVLACGALWDFWVLPHQGVFHLYYLQTEQDVPPQNQRRWAIGHAVSSDLLSWTPCGVVLRADAAAGHPGLATGSCVMYGGQGVMALTACAGGESLPGIAPYSDYGIAFARSDDLYHWRLDGAPRTFPQRAPFEGRGDAALRPPGCHCFGDPFLYTLAGDDGLHMLLNARLQDGEVRTRAAVAHTRTKDLQRFSPLHPLLAPGIAMRLETPQLFEKHGRWYLLASCHDALLSPAFFQEQGIGALGAAALVFTADAPDGPFALRGDFALFCGEGCYICKAVPQADALLTIVSTATQYPPRQGETGISQPHRIAFPAEGGIRVLGPLGC